MIKLAHPWAEEEKNDGNKSKITAKNSLIALRLCRVYCKDNEKDKAKSLLENAIEHNRNEKRLHFRYSLLLLEEEKPNHDAIEYHLKRSFTPGDKNYLAQILYGKELYVNNTTTTHIHSVI